MSSKPDMVVCRTPTPGKSAKRIDRWKYDAVRRVILAVLPADEPGVLFSELPGLVKAGLAADERAALGNVMWYTTTVKLELEVAGEIRRVDGAAPQRLVRVKKRKK